MHRVTLGQERGLLRTLGQERGLLRTLGQERGLLRTLGQERGLLRTLGQKRGLLRTLGQERGLLRTLGRSLVATVVAALAAAGCSDPGAEYCERYCACVDCSEREEDVCLAQRAAESDIAGVFDCDAELEDFESCVVTKETCPGGQFNTDVCNAEAQEYSTCKE